jgi:hypothetical protein
MDWLWGKSMFCKLLKYPCPLVRTLKMTNVRWTKRACFDIGKDLLDRIGRAIPTLEHLVLYVQNDQNAKWAFKKLGMCKLLKGCKRLESLTILGAEPDLSALRCNPDGSENTVTRHIPAPQLKMIKVPGREIEHPGVLLENLSVCLCDCTCFNKSLPKWRVCPEVAVPRLHCSSLLTQYRGKMK